MPANLQSPHTISIGRPWLSQLFLTMPKCGRLSMIADPIAKEIILHYDNRVLPSWISNALLNRARSFRAVLCVIALVAFISIGFVSTSHAHADHSEDPSPSHSVCDICIVATSDEDGFVIDAANPSPELDCFVPNFHDLFKVLALPHNVAAPTLCALRASQAPPRNLDSRPDPARAPPV